MPTEPAEQREVAACGDALGGAADQGLASGKQSGPYRSGDARHPTARRTSRTPGTRSPTTIGPITDAQPSRLARASSSPVTSEYPTTTFGLDGIEAGPVHDLEHPLRAVAATDRHHAGDRVVEQGGPQVVGALVVGAGQERRGSRPRARAEGYSTGSSPQKRSTSIPSSMRSMFEGLDGVSSATWSPRASRAVWQRRTAGLMVGHVVTSDGSWSDGGWPGVRIRRRGSRRTCRASRRGQDRDVGQALARPCPRAGRAQRAARMEAAPPRDRRRVGRLAAQGQRLGALPVVEGTASSSAACRGAGGAAGPPRPAHLDDPAEVHDRDPVGDVPRQAEVVADHESRQPSSSRRPRNSLRISPRTDASSDDTGSSATRTSGPSVSAPAMTTRCC